MNKDPGNGTEGQSRSAKKRAAHAVEALAGRLVEAGGALCNRLPLPDELREELVLARRITARGGRKRQLKRLGALLRRDEATTAAVQAALDAVGRSNRAERELFHRIEAMRDGLCDPDLFAETIETAAAELPDLDRKELTRLARKVHQRGDKRASREIFRLLRAAEEESAQGGGPDHKVGE